VVSASTPRATDHRTGPDGRGPDLLAVLTQGELTLDGRLVASSNNAMVGSARLGAQQIRCVYKPIRGERPLWDFPQGRLAEREVAAFLVARAAGWQVAPPTVLRDGPFGLGMAQQWIEDAEPDQVATVFPADAVPATWLPVMRAVDGDDRPLIVAHADTPELAAIAVFDVVANNADRKAGHLLVDPAGSLFGVDHGLTFHTEPKLRTILWGWAGRGIPAPLVRGLHILAERLRGPLAADLSSYLSTAEIAGLQSRVAALIAEPVFPLPPDDRTPIPWPPL
jgi:uncharacterized repeat protein (TIGR03843 family)